MLPKKLPWETAQTIWASQIEPVLSNPVNNISMLKAITLASGANVINHKLGRKPQGWIITDINAAATIYRSQPFNDLTLTLTSNAVATINLGVF